MASWFAKLISGPCKVITTQMINPFLNRLRLVNNATIFFPIVYNPVPSGYPSDVQIISHTSKLVKFLWKQLECYEENGPMIGYRYRIHYNHTNYSEGTLKANTHMLTLLRMNVQYFSVAAINRAGIGPHCPPVSVPRFDQGNIIFQKDLIVCTLKYMYTCLSTNLSITRRKILSE